MQRRWSVGELAELVGIAAPTLRTWDRRYGIGPSFRTEGGHRRYTIVDVDRVATMARFIEDGTAPRQAAEVVREMPASELAALAGSLQRGAGAHDYAVLSILAGAREFDGGRIEDATAEALRQFGIAAAWDKVLAPALIEVGRQWQNGSLGVAAEHLVSSRILTALRAAARRAPVRGPAEVVMASPGEEQHKLPVVALSAALAEQGVASHELGARLPLDALQAIVQATAPRVVFLWSSVVRMRPDDLERLDALAASTTVLLGGPGWPDERVTSRSLDQTLAQVTTALGHELP